MLSIITTITVCMLSAVNGFPGGPPLTSCTDMFPTGHKANAQTVTSPFLLTTSSTTYVPGGTVTVNMIGANSAFNGVFLEARRATSNCSSGINNIPVGTFTIPAGDTFLQLVPCNGVAGSAVAQKSATQVRTKSVVWNAPATSVGQVYFRATFIQNAKTFWTDVASPIVRPLGDTTAALSPCPVRLVL